MPHPDSPDRVRNCGTDVAGQLREISVRLELDAWLVFPWLIPEHRQLADDSAGQAKRIHRGFSTVFSILNKFVTADDPSVNATRRYLREQPRVASRANFLKESNRCGAHT
jgi:hypothetical protein